MALTKVRNINASDLSSGTIASARIANDSITPDHLAHTIGTWEVITTIANGAGYVGESDGQIKFIDVFSNKYMHYWLHIGFLGYGDRNNAANNADIYCRYLDGSSEQNSTAYYGHLERSRAMDAGYSGVSYNAPNTGTIWNSQWDYHGGGIYGDIYFYNMHAPVFNTGGSIDRGAYYRPYFKSEMLGYDTTQNTYAGQFSQWRYNQNMNDTVVDGFKIFNSSNAVAHPGTFMALYGMKHNPANTTSP